MSLGKAVKTARRNVRARPSGRSRITADRTPTELKNIDLTGSFAPGGATTTAAIELINGVAQGVTATTRLGRRICMRSVEFIYTINLPNTGLGATPWRFMIVYDKQTNAALPNANMIVEVDQLTSPLNLGNQRRFSVLFDRIIQCVGASGPQNIIFRRKIAMKKFVEFNANSAGTVGDISTGGLYALAWQTGGITVASVTGNLYTRILFSDS